MKKIAVILGIALVVMFFIINAIESDDDMLFNEKTEINYLSENNWYLGGNLHKENISKWKTSTEENKLATCADFIASINQNKKIDALKYEAIQLVDCINEATRDLPTTDNQKISEVASLCTITLGYK